MVRTFLFIVLVALVFSYSNAELNTRKKELPDYLNSPNITKIGLNDDLSLSIVNHQINLNGSNDHVLIETPNNVVLLSNFNSIRFALNSTNDKDEIDDNQRDKLLVEGSKKFDEWFNFKNLRLNTEFSFFNVTNPDEILKGAKPILKELGPYTYAKKKWYENLGWEDNENFINVKMFKKYKYVGALDLNERATIVNIPLLFIYNLIDTKGPNEINEETKKKLHEIFKDFPLFVTHKISDLLFDGFQDQLTANFKTYERRIRIYLKDYQLKTYRILKNGRFSVMGNKNNSNYGTWTINTGKSDIGKIGQLYKLDGNTTGCWAGACGVVRGTDGLINTPFINRAKSIEVFIPEHYRTVEFNKISYTDGVSEKTFKIASSTFNSGFNYLPNKCYLIDPNDEIFKKNGVLKSCPDPIDTPIVTSNPHFLHGSIFFTNQMEGLKPSEELHNSYIKFSTKTNELIEGKLKSQIDFDTNSISRLRGLPRYIFPVFWMSEGFERFSD